MKKICLSVVGLYLLFLHGFSQSTQDSTYKARKLKVDEVNLVSSYYAQNGNHSAVTGGIGTEKVTDISNGIELKFVGYDNTLHKHSLTAGLGLDHHTAASAAYVSKTGASKTEGTRIYPSLDWTIENEAKGKSFGIGTYYSTEYNYKSFGTDIHFSKKTADKNGEFSAKLQGYFDQVKMIYPSELIPASTTTVTGGGVSTITTASGRTVTVTSSGRVVSSESKIPSSPRNTFSASFAYTQVINKRLQMAFLLDVVSQNGYLGLPFHRVYFNTGKDTVENLPSTRFKLPLGLRINYFLGDNIILRSYFRYYTDDWGIHSNTASIEVAVKLTPFFSLSPFFRYYDQTAADYFAAYGVHAATDKYYTSNYALSQFQSNFFGMGLRTAPPKGVLGWETLHEMEIRYGHYSQTTDLQSNVISFSFGFK